MNPLERPSLPVSDERVDELWRRAAPRVLVKARARRRARRIGAALALVIAVGAAWRSSTPAPRPEQISSGQTVRGPARLSLADESQVVLEAGSSLTVLAAARETTRVVVDRGSAGFHVTPRDRGSFEVLVGEVTVRVVGTRFRVEQGDTNISVEVEEGVVDVITGREVRRLGAGARWSGASHTAAQAPVPSPEQPAATAEPTMPAPADAVTAKRPPPSPMVVRRPAAAKSRGAGSVQATTAPVEPPSATPRPAAADELFDAAVSARRAGRIDDAADAWMRFLDLAPDDPRAGLAAFELGRLEMDLRHRPGAAVAALERALVLPSHAAFEEDVLARLVRLHHGQGDRPRCEAARERYRSRFPAGAYRARLEELCTLRGE